MQRGRGLFLLPQEKGPRKGPFFIVLLMFTMFVALSAPRVSLAP